MRRKASAVFVAIVAIPLCAYYLIEPWAVTFVDDGPYFSSEYPEPVDNLTLQSKVELRKFGRLVYYLESRVLDESEQSVLVLRNPEHELQWARLPIKPNGELGTIELRKVYATWYGGWRISISPSNQEGGNLYLNIFGRYRFLNHSW